MVAVQASFSSMLNSTMVTTTMLTTTMVTMIHNLDHGYLNHGDLDHGGSKGREFGKMKPFLGQDMYLPLPMSSETIQGVFSLHTGVASSQISR